MEIYLKRLTHTRQSTLSLLSFDSFDPFGFIIEDEPRIDKVAKETRIPAGRYKLGIRKEDTPLTIKHQNDPNYKGWFKYHIEILNVPNFSGIYVHIVNKESHTEGCLGGAKTVIVNNGEYEAIGSAPMIKEFYSKVYPLLENGKEDVFITVIDE